MGVHVKEIYDDLVDKKKSGNLSGDESEFFKKWGKSIQFLSHNPRHPGLQSHPIDPLSDRYGKKVWQSYVGMGKHAWRMFWYYGPNNKEITIIGVESHPEDSKSAGYDKVKLSELPPKK